MPNKQVCPKCQYKYLKQKSRGCPRCKLDKDWEEYEKNQKIRMKHKKDKVPF